MDIDYAAIGHRIKTLRIKKKLTQDDLRFEANISKSHMSHIETGSTKLGLPTLMDIVNALGTTPNHLLCDSTHEPTEVFCEEITEIISDCSTYELNSMIEAMRFVKMTLRNKPNKSEDK